MVLCWLVLFHSIKGIAPKGCLPLLLLFLFPALFHLRKTFHVTNVPQLLLLSNGTCTVAAAKVEQPFPPLCSRAVLTFSTSTGPAPMKISGCSWNCPVLTHPTPRRDLLRAFLFNEGGIGTGDAGWFGDSDAILTARFREGLLSTKNIFPWLLSLLQCSSTQQHQVAWRLGQLRSDVVAPKHDEVATPCCQKRGACSWHQPRRDTPSVPTLPFTRVLLCRLLLNLTPRLLSQQVPAARRAFCCQNVLLMRGPAVLPPDQASTCSLACFLIVLSLMNYLVIFS